MIGARNVLPSSINGQQHKHSILSDIKQRYLNYLHKVASQKERDLIKLNKVQPMIEQLLVDNIFDVEFLINQASKKIEAVVQDNLEDLCSVALHGGIDAYDKKSTHDAFVQEYVQPKIVGYQLPILKIKPLYDSNYTHSSNYTHFNLPIFLKVQCETIQRSFKYDESNDVIIDYFSNMQWKIQKNKYPMKRKNDNNYWNYPSLQNQKEIEQYLNDYHKFCTDYNNFYRAITNKYIYQNYPEIKCIKRFRVDKGYHNWIIRDMLRQEEWKIIEKVKYSELLVNIRNSNWQVNTVESLTLFFNELKSSFKRNDVNFDIISMLSNKYFWTSSNFSTRTKMTILFDFDTNQISVNPEKKDNTCVGIVTRKIRGF